MLRIEPGIQIHTPRTRAARDLAGTVCMRCR